MKLSLKDSFRGDDVSLQQKVLGVDENSREKFRATSIVKDEKKLKKRTWDEFRDFRGKKRKLSRLIFLITFA